MNAALTVARREYRQIARTRAFKLTLVLVPVLYTIVVKDLKWIRWERPAPEAQRVDGPAEVSQPAPTP